jgi:hypothetical protein
VSQGEPESKDHPRGVAVRFVGVDEATTGRLQAFISRGRPE